MLSLFVKQGIVAAFAPAQPCVEARPNCVLVAAAADGQMVLARTQKWGHHALSRHARPRLPHLHMQQSACFIHRFTLF